MTEKFTPGEWCLRTINQFAEYGNSTKHIFEKKEDGIYYLLEDLNVFSTKEFIKKQSVT